ncbi:MAG: DUF1801 domain-containing protein [Bacteroidota bacterium]|nr:DUF1801 domain-containing protein [Bacteroidota bacterium]
MLTTVKNVDHYISLFPKEIQERLEQLRQTIKTAAPLALEVISYSMPAYKLNGMLLYFAAHKNHIGLYPMASGIEAFKSQLTKFETSKGTVQFPNDKPLPISLIKKIVKYRAQENINKVKNKSKK